MASNDLNQCSFIGRLGADPETRYMANGDPVCGFRIAVGWKTKEKEGAEWVSCSAFGKLAKICSEYLRKGSQVFVQGQMKTGEYEKNGEKRYTTKIVVDKMQMLGGKSNGDDSQAHTRPRVMPEKSDLAFDDLGDDIPF